LVIRYVPLPTAHDVAGPSGPAVIHTEQLTKVSKKQARYVLAVVPGDTRVDFSSLKAHLGGSYAAMADGDKAEQLAGSVAGTILPFSYDPRLELVVDPGLLSVPEMYFNAGRLDRSVALATEDYLRLASPRLVPISTRW
jgi:Ala-tRNA(Pro) deacylase